MSAADVITAEKAVTDIFDFVRGTTAAFPGGFEEKVMAAFNASHQQDRIKTSEINALVEENKLLRHSSDRMAKDLAEGVEIVGQMFPLYKSAITVLKDCKDAMIDLRDFAPNLYARKYAGLIESIEACLRESEE